MRLDDIPKRPWQGQVPEGYFEQLPDRIGQRLASGSPAKAPVQRSLNWKPYAAAASLLLALGVAWQFRPSATPQQQPGYAQSQQQLEQLDAEELELMGYDLTETDLLVYATQQQLDLASPMRKQLEQERLLDEVDLYEIGY